FSSRRRHTRFSRDWSSDVCSSDLHDYITKPFEIEDLVVAVEKALDERGLRREVARLRKEVARPYRFENIIGKSPAMQDVFALIQIGRASCRERVERSAGAGCGRKR